MDHFDSKNFFKDFFKERKLRALHLKLTNPAPEELPPINLAKKARKRKGKDVMPRHHPNKSSSGKSAK